MRWPFRKEVTGILVVCRANICRSPMAEGILRQQLQQRGVIKQFKVASAGTHAAQLGRRADPRAVKVCQREGVDIRRSRARKVRPRDFSTFDYILAVDEQTHLWLIDTVPQEVDVKLLNLAHCAIGKNWSEIPDPYYGSAEGFETVMEMLQECIAGFLKQLPAHLQN